MNLDLCCPICHGPLDKDDDGHRCGRCARRFPTYFGIHDFRIFGDPYLDLEADLARADLMMNNAARFDFPDLLEFYWSNSPETAPDLRRRFVHSALVAGDRAEMAMDEITNCPPLLRGDSGGSEGPATFLDIGCGTGPLLVAAARRYPRVVGVDIALRWLIVARKRFQAEKVSVPLICCCAEALPFPDGAFDVVALHSTLEHVRDGEAALDQAARVLRPGGLCFISTPNRFSLGIEPHCGLWGVGWLPRRWAKRYVRWRRNAEYKARLLSPGRLAKMLRHRFGSFRIFLPAFDVARLSAASAKQRRRIALYNRIRAVPVLRGLLLRVGPLFHAIAGKRVHNSPPSGCQSDKARID